jgi:hypothetical protein
LGRWLQFREPDPFENVYSTASTITLLGFLVTWAYVAVALAVLWLNGERMRGVWLHLWAAGSGVFVIWFFVGLVGFLFP